MRVRATKVGYIYDVLRDEDDEFDLKDKKHFSKNWMKVLGPEAVGESPGVEPEAPTAETLPVSGTGVNLEDACRAAIANGDVTDAGLPKVTKLSEVLGRTVTAEERDEAMRNVGLDQ